MNNEKVGGGVWAASGRGPALARGRSDWPANHRVHYFCIKKEPDSLYTPSPIYYSIKSDGPS